MVTMAPETGPQAPSDYPEWAHEDRLKEIEWIKENLQVFVPAAKAGFAAEGRGALVVDTAE